MDRLERKFCMLRKANGFGEDELTLRRQETLDQWVLEWRFPNGSGLNFIYGSDSARIRMAKMRDFIDWAINYRKECQ